MYKKILKIMSVGSFAAILGLMSLQVSADKFSSDPQVKGLQIAEKMKARDRGWSDSQTSLTMVLKNAAGQESTRELRAKALEIQDDGDKSLNIFDYPRDIKGTAFLSFSHAVGADDQWLYLPALKRVKRIASRNKSGPFVGSEFAYEDLASFEVEKYTYTYLRDEPCKGGTCFVIEQTPVDKYSGYTRLLNWVDQTEYRSWQTEFYDRRNSLLKTLNVEGFELYLNAYWRATGMSMVNHQTKKTTDLLWSAYEFKIGLTDQDFNKNTLKRAK
jgi:hypothetical protein